MRVYLDEVRQSVVDVRSLGQEETAARADVVKEEKLLVLKRTNTSK